MTTLDTYTTRTGVRIVYGKLPKPTQSTKQQKREAQRILANKRLAALKGVS